MYRRVDIHTTKELFLKVSERESRGVYFVRLCGLNDELKKAVWDFHEAARVRGVIIDEQIGNPDGHQLDYYREVLGTDFQNSELFIQAQLKKWMPRLEQIKAAEFAGALSSALTDLSREGKSDGIIKNIYIKLMCWLYYRFERLVPYIGDDSPAKILYVFSENITSHELLMLRILNDLGTDILLVELGGDSAYLKADPRSKYSQLFPSPTGFPQGFTLKSLRKEIAAQQMPPVQRPKPVAPVQQPAGPVRRTPETAPRREQAVDFSRYFKAPEKPIRINDWMKETNYDQILTPPVSRSGDGASPCTVFIRIAGAADKVTYKNDMYQFVRKLRATGRRIVIADGGIEAPSPDELSAIRRHNYRSADEMIVDLAGNLPSCANTELQRRMQWGFVQIMKDAAKAETNINRLLTSAVYLLCWIRKYQKGLFSGYRENEISCFVLMGGCRDERDALFMRYLTNLPVDILILAPDLNRLCALKDEKLIELRGKDSVHMFPLSSDGGRMAMDTVASHAERELDSMLYSGGGMFRERQFTVADSIPLKTTYDEIFLLWNQEMKYRPNFSITDEHAELPVVFAKVCGVKNGKIDQYWQSIRQLLGPDTYLSTAVPINTGSNSYMSLAVNSIRKGRLCREEIRKDRMYPFGLLRDELQEHIFNKIQLMLDSRMISGTFENGTEYTVLATILNLKKEWIRMIQKFDFTKLNPKFVWVVAGEQTATVEDAILITFLSLIGFDVVLFVPTGYQTFERFTSGVELKEHQMGEYLYDLSVPDIAAMPERKGIKWLNNIFRRGV